jgi:hypothetical protein
VHWRIQRTQWATIFAEEWIYTQKFICNVKLSEMRVKMSNVHSELVDLMPAHFLALQLCIGAFITLNAPLCKLHA